MSPLTFKFESIEGTYRLSNQFLTSVLYHYFFWGMSSITSYWPYCPGLLIDLILIFYQKKKIDLIIIFWIRVQTKTAIIFVRNEVRLPASNPDCLWTVLWLARVARPSDGITSRWLVAEKMVSDLLVMTFVAVWLLYWNSLFHYVQIYDIVIYTPTKKNTVNYSYVQCSTLTLWYDIQLRKFYVNIYCL